MPSTGTPASSRAAPSRRFENYILTRVDDPSEGLSGIRDSAFTQFSGPADYTGFNIGQGFCDDGYSNTYPIGFDFQLDGITYKQFVANANGWMALVDPNSGSFAGTEVLTSVTGTVSPWNNASIKPTFSSHAVLLAPWFDDLRNVANVTTVLTGSPTSFSTDKVNHINQGIEPRPIQFDQVAYGVSYANDVRSSRGRRLVVRWNSLSNHPSPSSVIKFEAVLYENGTIEYRYAPRPALSLSTGAAEGATIGIFMPNGTNRFRDFAIGLGYRDDARSEYAYGGFIYTASYIDAEVSGQEDFPASASYTINLTPSRYWPGQATGGSIFTLSPPVARRKVLPRQLVRSRDSRPTYPSIARTGGDGGGTYLKVYDDRRAPRFASIVNTEPVGVNLDNLSWLLPRISDSTSTVYNCPNTSETVVELRGDPTIVYDVTLRFRGVVEQKTYTGGTNDGAYFQIGGSPAADLWNVYSLTVSDPPQTYYLNRGTSGQFTIHQFDYTKTIKMRGGATVTLLGDSIGGQEIANNSNTGGPLAVPGLFTNPQPGGLPYVGQFSLITYITSSFTSSIPVGTQVVNYPTTLPRFFGGTGLGTLQRQDLFAGDMLVTGNIVNSAVAPYLMEEPQEPASAFNEEARPDQGSPLSTFFATGSSVVHVGPGFDQSLRSKTQLKIQLPVDATIQMPASTSSIYYYNSQTHGWEVPANSSYILANGASTPPLGNKGDWADPINDAINGRIIEDARGFGPIGNTVSSGSHVPSGAGDQTDAMIGLSYTRENSTLALSKRYPNSVRSNDAYSPSAGETFTLPINQPFLIEKMVIDVPLSMGPGWFNDMTQVFQPLTGTAVVGSSPFDFAGPALTVALSRQVQFAEASTTPALRDLILTGTIIPTGDAVSSIVISSFSPYNVGYQVRPVGFNAYAAPAGAIVQPNAGNQFTGSVSVQCQALSSVGNVLRVRLPALVGTQVQSLMTASSVISLPSATTSIAYISPFGRSGEGFQQAGRAILGNEHSTLQGLQDPTGATAPNPFYVGSAGLSAQFAATLAGGGTFDVVAAIPLVSHFPSPYLFMPGDKLILSISKMRPFVFNCSGSNPTFSGSLHDVNLTNGTINITLYGSLVQEGSEYHDLRNQSLVTDAVHEVVGNDPVLDQFEPAYRNEYTGSFSDNVMLGNLLTPTAVNGQITFTQGVRDRKLSRLNARNAPVLTSHAADVLINPSKAYRLQPWYEQVGNVRTSQFFDSSERYWDSMLPAIDQCFQADGVGIFTSFSNAFGLNVDPNIGFILFDTGPSVVVESSTNLVSNANWTRAFPFEPRYSQVNRTLSVATSFNATYNYDGSSVNPITPMAVSGFLLGFYGQFPLDGVLALEWLCDHNLTKVKGSNHITGSASIPDLIRGLYGFGDNNNMVGSDPASQIGGQHLPSFRDVDPTYLFDEVSSYCFSPVIRGWKYGIISGLPLFSKCYWRHGKFGQFRDLLEQRPMTKYYESPENSPDDPIFKQGIQDAAVSVRFISPDGRLTDPANTWSSNLSLECTSSLPYFEGHSYNRPTPVQGSLNQHIVSLGHDLNGNILLGNGNPNFQGVNGINTTLV